VGKTAVAIDLTDSEWRELESFASRRKTAQGLAQRARIVLLAAEGAENKDISLRVNVAPNTVGKWRRRFAEHRLAGLLDEPRPGAPRQIGDDEVAERELLSFLREIERNVPRGLDVHLVMDNSATHKTPAIRKWLGSRPRWHVHFTPTGSSWVNERGKRRSAALGRGSNSTMVYRGGNRPIIGHPARPRNSPASLSPTCITYEGGCYATAPFASRSRPPNGARFINQLFGASAGAVILCI